VFDARMVIANKGFIRMKKIAQEMGRARNLTCMDTYIYLVDNKRFLTQCEVEKAALTLLGERHPDSVTPACSSHDGSITFEPTDNLETVYRMQLARETVSECNADNNYRRLALCMDNPGSFDEAPGYHDAVHDVPGWDDAVRRAKRHPFEDWKKVAYHFLHHEVIRLLSTTRSTQNRVSDATRATHLLHITQSVIMPYMVCKSSQSDGGHSLTREFLYDVYKNFKQLENLLWCVSSKHNDEMLMMNVAQEMFPEAGFRSGEMLNKNIKSLTFAVLTACAQHVTLKLSTVSATKGKKEQEDVFSLATVTPKQQKEACEWLATNWSHGVRAVMLEVGS
jgi:hypothetical protein